VLDLLGYGRSDRRDLAASTRRPTNESSRLDELRITACIVGHGMGGGVAQLIATQFATRVSHLCLVNSVGFDRWPSVATRGQGPRWLRFLPPGDDERFAPTCVVTAIRRANRSMDSPAPVRWTTVATRGGAHQRIPDRYVLVPRRDSGDRRSHRDRPWTAGSGDSTVGREKFVLRDS
jgi:pimeloyl-ACP methyl ester carboxylesterase